MKQKIDPYTYRVTWSEEDSEYVGLYAEFPSLSWLASSPETALRGIRRVVADVLADMRKRREPSRKPLRPEDTAASLWFEYLLTFIVGSQPRRPRQGSA